VQLRAAQRAAAMQLQYVAQLLPVKTRVKTGAYAAIQCSIYQ